MLAKGKPKPEVNYFGLNKVIKKGSSKWEQDRCTST